VVPPRAVRAPAVTHGPAGVASWRGDEREVVLQADGVRHAQHHRHPRLGQVEVGEGEGRASASHDPAAIVASSHLPHRRTRHAAHGQLSQQLERPGPDLGTGRRERGGESARTGRYELHGGMLVRLEEARAHIVVAA
jgi:hypothetical protein